MRPATGGSGEPGAGASGTSADDTDTGWERSTAGEDDERWLRERPPHWG